MQLLALRERNLRMARHLAMEPCGAALLRADAQEVDGGQRVGLVRSRVRGCGNASLIIECDSGPGSLVAVPVQEPEALDPLEHLIDVSGRPVLVRRGSPWRVEEELADCQHLLVLRR